MARPHFTKEHYKDIAELIRGALDDGASLNGFIDGLTGLFMVDNPAFDMVKFLRTAGLLTTRRPDLVRARRAISGG